MAESVRSIGGQKVERVVKVSRKQPDGEEGNR